MLETHISEMRLTQFGVSSKGFFRQEPIAFSRIYGCSECQLTLISCLLTQVDALKIF